MTSTHSPLVEIQFLINNSRLFVIYIKYTAYVFASIFLVLVLSGIYQSRQGVAASSSIGIKFAKARTITAATKKVKPSSVPATLLSFTDTSNGSLTQEQKWERQAAKANADGKYDRLARCETRGNWRHYNSEFAGGVGFRHRAWRYWKLPGMPDNAAEATKAEQIVVAERIRWELAPKGSFHGGKWGCAGAARMP